MLIDLSLALSKPIETEIKGEEPWLGDIYQSFLPTSAKESARLLAKTSIRHLSEEMFEITGSLSYTPEVPCSRCDLAIPWAIDLQFQMVILPEGQEWAEHGQSPEICYHKNRQFDLEALINDQVQLAIPQQTLLPTADGKNCAICHLNIGNKKVFSSEGDGADEESPFSVLKGLKLQ